MTNTNLKAQIDNNITNETAPLGITPGDVGSNMKAVVDYVDQEAALKANKATGFSLLADTEISRLASMTAIFTTALKNTYDAAVSSLTGKEDASNKSTNVNTDGASDSKYPSVKAVKTYVDEKDNGYKEYSAIIKNKATGIEVNVLKNELPATLTWTYPNTGQFEVTASSPIFTTDKTIHLSTVYMSGGLVFLLHPNYDSTTVISYLSVVPSVNGVAGMQNDTPIPVQIRVYN
jgi:hypothetical protein